MNYITFTDKKDTNQDLTDSDKKETKYPILNLGFDPNK